MCTSIDLFVSLDCFNHFMSFSLTTIPGVYSDLMSAQIKISEEGRFYGQ